MAIRWSTGARDFLGTGGSYKKMFNDGILKIYSGVQPASADASIGGATLLCTLTLASGALTPGTASTAQVSTATITYGVDGNAYALVINGTSYSYTTSAGDDAPKTATKLAALINADYTNLTIAFAVSNVVYVWSKFPGESFTIANTGTTTGGNNVIATPTANSRINALHMGDIVDGSTFGLAAGTQVLSKESGVWSGVIAATGTAGWWRLSGDNADDTTLSTTYFRVDGNCGTSNADWTLSSVNFVSGTTFTANTFGIEIMPS